MGNDAEKAAKKAAKKAQKKRLREEAAGGGESEDEKKLAVEEKPWAGTPWTLIRTLRNARREELQEKKKKKSIKEDDGKKVKKAKKADDAPKEGSAVRRARGGDFVYEEHADVQAMTAAEVSKVRDRLGMTVDTGDHEIKPVTEFIHAGFIKPLEKRLCADFAKPSPIQSQCWPIILCNRDLIGIAATGSGKTLAFGAPGLMMCAKTKMRPIQPCMAVLAPTRELAIQIGEVLHNVGEVVKVESAIVYGGMPKYVQKNALKTAHIVVATPGRLQDLMQEGSCDLSKVKYMVLDEADRMLDLGFEKEVRAIIGATPTSLTRQTVMFSATWPKDAAKLASDFLSSPLRVNIGSAELSASHTITQIVEVLEMNARDEKLDQLLKKYHNGKNRCLIFVLYKKEAPRLEQTLTRKGHKVVAIHGDMTQEGRLRALEGFKNGKTPMMIATDVAARGLDIPDVEFVINYSFPLTVEDYVHRIGRTGRAGKTGTAHTFFTIADKQRAGELVNVLNEAKQPVPPDLLKFGTHVKKKESKLYGAHFKDVDMNAKATKTTFSNESDSD